MKNKKIILFNLLFFVAFILSAQIKSDEYKIYQIDKIIIHGLKEFNPETVKAFIGVSKGDIIEVPGDKTKDIIEKLWDLGYFSDINLYITPTTDNKVDLEIELEELPKISVAQIKGVSKSKSKEFIKKLGLLKNVVLNENIKAKTIETIKKEYIKKGFLNTKVSTRIIKDTAQFVKFLVNVDKGYRIKVNKINIIGNSHFSAGKIKRKLKNTKEKRIWRFWKRSKYIADDFKDDIKKLEDFYKEEGYRNARVLSDSVYFDQNDKLNIDIKVEEGKKYYFGNIEYVGNSAYPDDLLQRILGIKKGDPYNGILLKKRIDDPGKPDGENITNLYQNNGYLFSRINVVETGVRKDTIDFEIRIYEGKPAKFNKITIVGNEKTNDYVIFRELRTIPGNTYSKQNVVRSVRELSQLGFFDAEKISPEFKNVDANAGTVDIEWNVREAGSSQVQLQGGFDGRNFIGTVGLSFNNFSIRNIFNGKAYKPLPMGDGQKLSLSLQMSRFYETYSLSFTEPWLGGKKPQSLNVSLYSSTYYGGYTYAYNAERDTSKKFLVSGLSVGLTKKLRWPDDYFIMSQSLSFNHYNFKNYDVGLFGFDNGFSNNFSYNMMFGRNSSGPNPIYPMGGSEFFINLKMTPPYSLFSTLDYATLKDNPDFQDENGNPDYKKINRQKYSWLEYYKVKFTAAWYTNIVDKLVLRTKGEFGILGDYNKDLGVGPFERFYVGGNGLSSGSMISRDVIPLRGYEDSSLNRQFGRDGGIVYNKFSLELRYPITLKPQASIYVLSFLEGGNTYNNIKINNPFSLKKSAGVGIRIFMSAFGLLGVDFGYGFDKVPNNQGIPVKSGWQTHFIMSQRL